MKSVGLVVLSVFAPGAAACTLLARTFWRQSGHEAPFRSEQVVLDRETAALAARAKAQANLESSLASGE